MATQQIAGAGGTTTSFSNTPQAQNDVFYFTEDSSGVLVLNVLANDLGGAAKQLYSIDDATSASTATKTPAPTDLLVRDTTYSSDSVALNGTSAVLPTADKSALGARIWISSDGTIHYNTADINTLLQSLAQGQVITDKLTYAIQLGNGTLSWATTTIQFTGTNDKPVIGAATLVGAVTEDAHTPTETATGTIAFSDVDLTDVHLVSAVFKGTDYGGQLGSLAAVETADTTGTGSGGLITWTFTAADSALNQLAAGQTVHETYTVTLDDQHGGVITRDIVITITGTNDAPTITAAGTNAAGSVVEDASTTPDLTDSLDAAGTVAFHDVDLIDSHTATFLPTAGETALGTFSLDPVSEAAGAADGSVQWHYALNNNAAQYLAAGQSVVEHYSVTVDDGNGGTATQVVAITITGTNDAATVSSDSKPVTEGDTAAA
ncbi:type I secretion protein, partial [Mesorhizobium sp. B4-1-3]|uniref:VCBS domain-containing protein n=1 Tax=Mesorhizobium sp. B4-1-3 TaxID=2589889 RepID=UPI0011749683